MIFAAAVLSGLVIGIFSGMLGIGGGTVMVPLLRLGFGVSAVGAAATSLFTIIPTSISGCVAHVRNRTCLVGVGVAAGLGGAVTSAAGAWLGNASPPWAVMLAAGVIIAFAAITMVRKALKSSKNDGAADSAETASAEGSAPTRLDARSAVIAFLIGSFAGLCAGYVGVGGGFIMVPLFLGLLGVSSRQASGTSLLAIMILSLPGVVVQCMLGNVDYLLGIALAVGSIPGAFIGAQLVHRISERKLSFIFAAFLILAAVILVVNEFQVGFAA